MLLIPLGAAAYPGGTPDFQTDAAPYCASCHSSVAQEDLAGAGERAGKELAERKHLSVVLSGQKGYAKLSEPDRVALAEQVRALDAASTISMKAPTVVKPGQVFQVQISLTGGGGPVVGVSLVDRPHRWHARPAPSAGWSVVAAPQSFGSDGSKRDDWIERVPEAQRNISYVNVTGIASDSAQGEWDSAEVIFTLRAPDRPGTYPLAAAYFYGTEKSSVLGYTTNEFGYKLPRGSYLGGSGRVRFTPLQQIEVR
jgi:hypothetical protein